MIQHKQFLKEIKESDSKKVYLFCGIDENLIKEDIELIKKKILEKNFMELNYVEYDGEKVTEDILLNACETLPFMSDKKVVMVYRGNFLKGKEGKSDRSEEEKVYKFLKNYVKSIPEHCILIMYYLFDSNRDKPSEKIKKIENSSNGVLVKVDKLKGEELRSKVKKIFDDKGKEIGKIELTLFCNLVESNTHIIENEVEKLCSYANGREITKEDIYEIAPQKSENDIFNLVDSISKNNIKKSLDILNELVFRGEKITYILYMIQRQYKLLLDIKLRNLKGYSKDAIATELRLHPYVCETMILQSKSFSEKYLEFMNMECLQCEKRLKTLSTEQKTELEMLIVKGASMKRIL